MPTNTSNMGLIVPTIGVDSGLTWEQSVNANATTLDGHDHSAGKGVQITPSGLNINTALPFNNQQATSLQAIVFQVQASLAVTNALYVKGVDLYFNDGSGNVVQMTTGGTVNATSSGIASGTATASFVSSVLVVNANTNLPANIKAGSILIGNNVVNSKYLTLQPPNAMAADYSLTLPAIPGSQSFMTVDTSGNMSGYASINQGIARTNLVAVGQQISSSCGNFSVTGITYTDVTNLSVTITTSGRPVAIYIQNDGSGSPPAITAQAVSTSAGILYGYKMRVLRGATEVVAFNEFAQKTVGTTASVGQSGWSVCKFLCLDVVVAGTYTYKVQSAGTNSNVDSIGVNNAVLVAYEL